MIVVEKPRQATTDLREAEALIREARQRQRKRWVLTIVVVLLAAVLTSIWVASGSRSGTKPPSSTKPGPVGPPTAQVTGFKWSELATKSAPSPRVNAPMAYDAATGQFILVGGARDFVRPPNPVGKTTQLDDTWVFTGTTWRQLHPATAPPAQPSVAAYDAASRQLILVAESDSANRHFLPSSTWTWTGRTWRRLAGTTPSPGTWEAMAYDPATRQLVFVGAATWVLRDSKWRRASSQQPSLNNVVFDPLN
jgi:hypothetical protein